MGRKQSYKKKAVLFVSDVCVVEEEECYYDYYIDVWCVFVAAGFEIMNEILKKLCNLQMLLLSFLVFEVNKNKSFGLQIIIVQWGNCCKRIFLFTYLPTKIADWHSTFLILVLLLYF